VQSVAYRRQFSSCSTSEAIALLHSSALTERLALGVAIPGVLGVLYHDLVAESNQAHLWKEGYRPGPHIVQCFNWMLYIHEFRRSLVHTPILCRRISCSTHSYSRLKSSPKFTKRCMDRRTRSVRATTRASHPSVSHTFKHRM